MAAPPNLVYVGTYTRTGRAEGIYVFSCDPATGRLTLRSSIAEQDPSFLAFDPSRRFLFATSEGLTSDEASVSSFSIDAATGSLAFLSRQPTGGGEPCHLRTDRSGSHLIVANHENGTVAVFPVDGEGRLGPMSDFRQHPGLAPHAHHVAFDPNGERVLITDKGIDQVVVYRLRAGKLVPNDPESSHIHAGAQPRHLAWGNTGQFAYVNGEADMTLATCEYSALTGMLREIQSVSTVPADTDRTGCSTAEVEVASSGRFVYVSNRGHDSIAVFAIDGTTGHVRPIGHVSTQGRTPRHFALDPAGRRMYVGNQGSDTIVHFDVDVDTGELVANGDVTEVGAPVCILFS